MTSDTSVVASDTKCLCVDDGRTTHKAVLWISAKLYRVGILMYGKRATLPELIRWLRYS